jgi:hypothetical protein
MCVLQVWRVAPSSKATYARHGPRYAFSAVGDALVPRAGLGLAAPRVCAPRRPWYIYTYRYICVPGAPTRVWVDLGVGVGVGVWA